VWQVPTKARQISCSSADSHRVPEVSTPPV
jgi:hypothetical protein